MRTGRVTLWIGATLTALSLFAAQPPSAVAAGGGDCDVISASCEVHDVDSPKPVPTKSDRDKADEWPELPSCASFPGASDSPPEDPDGWVQIGCMEGSIAITLWVEGGGASAEQIARSLVARVQLKPIEIGLVPRGADPMTVVGMPVWLWVEDPTPTTWGPATISAGGVSLTAKVTSVVWDMGDGTTFTCGKGTEWKRGMGGDPSPTCGHTYSEQGSYTIRARSRWVATWSGYGQSGTIPVTLSTTRQLDVGEIQVIETGG